MDIGRQIRVITIAAPQPMPDEAPAPTAAADTSAHHDASDVATSPVAPTHHTGTSVG